MPIEGSILVATDLSARCDRAMERALVLGKQLGAPVTILHVLDPRRRLDCSEEERLRAILKDEFELDPQKTDIRFDYGSAPDVIANVAEELDCLLIVTGVARYNSPRDYVLGTAIDYLIRLSPVPVLVVKRRARRAYERLVIATDFSASADRALLVSAALFPTAGLLLAHAYEPAFEAFLSHDTTAPLVREESDVSMSRLVSRLPLTLKARIKTINEEGRMAEVIAREISDRGSDLLVLGSTSRGGHAHFLTSHDLWSLPETEPCDVLVVR